MRLLAVMLMIGSAGVGMGQVGAEAGQGASGTSVVALMQPALSTLQQSLETVRVDKWKASGTVKDEAQSNIGSIQRDVRETLPGLLADADAAPGQVTRLLPAYRNVEALYNVLLRVASAGRVAAPDAQSGALEEAVKGLSEAQRSMGERLVMLATTQEKQVGALQAKVQAAAAPPPQVACPAPATTPKKRTKKPAQ